MNTHPQHVTERALHLAETLRSFSLQPVSSSIEPPKHWVRRLVLTALLLSLLSGAAIAIAVYRPHLAVFATLATAENRRDRDVLVDDNANMPQSVKPVATPAAREITGSGFVVAPRRTTVFSKYEGRITDVAVEAGDAVVAGQVLVTLDDAGARFALEQAKAAKAAAELQWAARVIDGSLSRASLARIEILAGREATSRQALDEARATAEQASNAVQQARQSVESADLSIRMVEERLDELTVRAPYAGIVTRLDAHVGDTVLARADSVRESESLLAITDMTSLRIDADVSETNLAALRTGLRGEAVLDGFPDRPFAVTVQRLAPVVSAEKGTLALRLSLDHPPEGIQPNMAARIRIPLDHTGDTTQ